MIQILLLLVLISSIGGIKVEDSKQNEKQIKYVGPIVYSNEKPPIVVFPTPTSTAIPGDRTAQYNVSLKDASIEYVPFPYQELPVLIYKSKDNPPIHMVSDEVSNSSSNIDKRLGETANIGNQRGGRALKWSNFKLFNDKPLVMKTQKRGPFDYNGLNSMSTHMIDMNNSSPFGSLNSQLSLANAPHVVYSGHPPIHVFPQPIIIKEPEFSEMAASETYHSLKSPTSGNTYETPVSTSNKNDESKSSPASTQFYSYSGTPLGSGNSKSYGFRVKTRGNKQDTDYSSSNNYENYDDTYSPQHSDGSSDSQPDDTKFKPSSHSNSIGSDSSNEKDYDREYDRPIESYSREKSREKYPKYSSTNWMDWDSTDNSWLSSLFGYNRYPSRLKRPMTLSIVNSPTNEHLVFAASPGNPFEMENMALMNPHIRHNGWVTAMNPMRPTSSAIRPVYSSFSNLFNYRRPPMPAPPPSPYYLSPTTRFSPGLVPPSANVPPMKTLGLMPPMMGLPSVSYPLRIPISPFMMYGMRRPTIGLNGDLAFAESTRNTTNNGGPKKWANIHDDFQMSGSHVQPTYVLPSAKPTGASIQKKPPIIIYQGLRPPVHVYKQPNTTIGSNSEVQNSLMSALQKLQENQEKTESYLSDEQTTTSNPYYQFFTTEDSLQFL